jgi:membrane protein YqaA with SNARE-associated domain
MESSIQAVFEALSIPWVGLGSVGIFAFLSSTLLPLSSEIPFYAYLSNFPQNAAALIAVATFGNSLGGVFNWWMGKISQKAFKSPKKPENPKITHFIHTYGPKSLVFSWVPLIGDTLTAVAGWYQLPFIPCATYLTIGKFLRYVVIVVIYFAT